MTIGILTYNLINNFGAQLQAASTQNFLAQHGYDAELVDFRPQRVLARSIMSVARPLLRGKIGKARSNAADNRMFRNSIGQMARLSARHTYFPSQVESLCAHYDVLICGSDELWNFGNYLGYMPPYILDFKVRDGVRKISYAASLGDFTPSGDILSRMKTSLSDFDAIMVRDPTTLAFVQSLGLAGKRVVDPTLLVDLPAQLPSESNYLMLTGALSDSQVRAGRAAAQELGLKPISVGFTYPGHEDISVGRVTPLQWIGYIKSASMHVTSLFHGAVFSMKYRTPFAVYVTPRKEQKIQSLVDLFGQPRRLVQRSVDGHALAECASLGYSDDFERAFAEQIAASQGALLAAVDGRA